MDGILMRGSRIVIPKALQEEMLQRIHTSGHQGITKCRERARQSVWWPGLSTQLEEVVKACKTCCIHQQQRPEPLIPSELPQLPWQKVGTDLFEWKSHNYLWHRRLLLQVHRGSITQSRYHSTGSDPTH